VSQGPKLKGELVIRDIRLTDKQIELIRTIRDKNTNVVFISGPAGTAKTYTSILSGLHLFNDKKISNMIYIRSAVECSEEKLGFLPGELKEKMDPYTRPLTEKLAELLSVKDARMLVSSEMVVGMPINYLRGLNWNAKFIIADEAQNLTEKELTTLITRVGKYSTLVICGDPYQVDIKKSGFTKFVDFFSDDEDQENGMYSYELTDDDILRGEFCKYVVKKLKTLKSYKK
jgi:phosphate starvation-inducible PhoH-like protein